LLACTASEIFFRSSLLSLLILAEKTGSAKVLQFLVPVAADSPGSITPSI
jgi:hypothetical protein